MHSPLEQFKINKLIDIHVMNVDLSITNATVFMLLATACVILFMHLATSNKALIPTKVQLAGENLYNLINNMLVENVGKGQEQYIPMIFTVFMFILFCNMFGMVPYGFTVTSHIAVTFVIAAVVFVIITIIGFVRHKMHFLHLFAPKGVPGWLAPLIIAIEFFTYMARPVSLSLRLAANMVAGHVLLKVLAGFIISLPIFFKVLPMPLLLCLIGFEFFVAVLQAYIFTILSCVYLNDAVNLH